MMSLVCGHADRRQRDAQRETQAGQAQALLPRDIQQKCTMRGGLGQQLQGTRGLSQIRGLAFAMRVPVYNMNTSVTRA